MKVGIRWYSETNHWMDCIVFVDNLVVNEAKEIISEAMEDFWDDGALECESYGELIENALFDANIDYIIFYCPWNDELDQPEDWINWEKWIEYIQRQYDIYIIS